MKFIIDVALIVLFFVVYKVYDIYIAIAVTMVAYLLQFLVQTIIQRKIDKVQMGLAGLVLILGSSTLLFRNELFFMWKPTLVYWILAIILYGAYRISKKTLLQRMAGHAIDLPENVWVQLNYAWVIFFGLLGLLNLAVAYFFSVDVWVHFKLFGLLGLMVVFLVAQGVFISKHMHKV